MPSSTRTPSNQHGSANASVSVDDLSAAVPSVLRQSSGTSAETYDIFAARAIMDIFAQIDRNLDLADQHLSRA